MSKDSVTDFVQPICGLLGSTTASDGAPSAVASESIRGWTFCTIELNCLWLIVLLYFTLNGGTPVTCSETLLSSPVHLSSDSAEIEAFGHSTTATSKLRLRTSSFVVSTTRCNWYSPFLETG